MSGRLFQLGPKGSYHSFGCPYSVNGAPNRPNFLEIFEKTAWEATGIAELKPITQILEAVRAGDPHAAQDLLPLVYGELRRLAEARLAGTPPGQTLQATALVHEAYLRLIGREDPGWENRGHFFLAAARAIQDILVEHARHKGARKRGGQQRRMLLTDAEAAAAAPLEDLLALREALTALERDDANAHRVVMLRFFAGLTDKQTADALGSSERTVRREWRYARARLNKELGGDTETGDGGDTDA
jgi:RNA polymerase sigma factor (TIGR02999 family)